MINCETAEKLRNAIAKQQELLVEESKLGILKEMQIEIKGFDPAEFYTSLNKTLFDALVVRGEEFYIYTSNHRYLCKGTDESSNVTISEILEYYGNLGYYVEQGDEESSDGFLTIKFKFRA